VTWQRRAVAALLGVLAATLLAGGLTRLEVDTRVTAFLPPDDPVVEQMDQVARDFGGDPVVVLLETGDDEFVLDAERLPRLLQLEGRLAGLRDVAVVYGPATTLNQIAIQAQNLLATISGRRDGIIAAAERAARDRGLSEAEVTRAGQRAVAPFEERYGSMLAEGLPTGLPTLHNDRFVRSVSLNAAGDPKPHWRFVIPEINAAAIVLRPRQDLDQAATERLVGRIRAAVDDAGLQVDRVTVTGSPQVAASLGHQVRRELPILGAAAFGLVALCLMVTPWTRRSRRLLPLVAMVGAVAGTLAVFGWLGRPISVGAIAFLPVLLGLGSYYPVYLAQRAHRRVVLTVAVAAAASFAALIFSPLAFVRDLGLALALGLLLAVGLGLLLARWGAGQPATDAGRDRSRISGTSLPPGMRLLLLVPVVLVAVVGWGALPGLPLEARADHLVGGLDAIDDARHAEEVIGSSGEVVVSLTGPDVLSPEALAWQEQANAAIVVDHADAFRPVLSPASLLSFLGPDPTADQIKSAMRLLPPYLTGAVVSSDLRSAVMSYGVRLDDLDQQAANLDGLRSDLPPPPAGYQVEVSGLPVAAARSLDLVSDSRYLANLLGVVCAGLVLLAGLRRRLDVLAAVVAALVATGLELALIAALGMALTPLTVALGSLTAAVGCEFAVLLLQAARRGDRTLGRSVGLAAVLSAAGYLVLVFSGLAVIRQFGLLLATSVGLSFLAAVVIVRCFPGRATAGLSGDGETEPGDEEPSKIDAVLCEAGT
jgi:predicted RND superfamily exporter protein